MDTGVDWNTTDRVDGWNNMGAVDRRNYTRAVDNWGSGINRRDDWSGNDAVLNQGSGGWSLGSNWSADNSSAVANSGWDTGNNWGSVDHGSSVGSSHNGSENKL